MHICTPDGSTGVDIEATLARANIPVVSKSRDAVELVGALDDSGSPAVIVEVRRVDAGLDAVRELTAAEPSVDVVLVCERSGAGEIRRALDAGVKSLVLASDAERVLTLALGLVHRGQITVPAAGRSEAGKQVLTTRQRQTLRLAVAGLTNSQIASELYLAESTVKSHLSACFAKLGVTSRSEAAALALDPVRSRELGIAPAPGRPEASGPTGPR